MPREPKKIAFAALLLGASAALAEPGSLPASAPASQAASRAASQPASQPASAPLTASAPPPATPAPAAGEEGFSVEAVEGLLADMEILVEVAQSGGWQIDRYEVEELLPDALASVCRVYPEVRAAALAELEGRIEAAGGPLEEAWKKNPNLKKQKKLIYLTRVKMLLETASAHAAADCPVYIEPEPEFLGRQRDAGRFTLHAETDGTIQIRLSEGVATYGGGGTGRLLIGRGFRTTSLLLGVEVSGSGLLTEGFESAEFALAYFAALPVVLRLHRRSWHYELESGPCAILDVDGTIPASGFRVGAAVGVRSKRTRGFIPWAGLAVAWDHYFPGDLPPSDFLRGGFRVGFILN